MEHLEELNSHIKQSRLIDELLKRVPSIGFDYERRWIGITESDNRRYTLEQVTTAIGKEAMHQAIQHFEDLLMAELYKAKAIALEEISRYSLSKG